ncbi:MAG: YafY family protein [Phycisphaeraceae bacterium]
MAGDYRRIHRLLELITLIQAEPGYNARRLAERFGVAERSIYRDLEVLETIGIPYYFDDETSGYRIRRDFFLPPIDLTLDESLALIALARHVGEQEQIPFMRPASRAIVKLRGQLPAALREPIEQLENHVDIHLAAAGASDGIVDVYEVVRQAIATGQALRCSYESLEAREDPRRGEEVFRFEPYALLFSQRAWYAVGHHAGRDDVRSLKLQRFSRCELTDERYAIPEDFSLNAHLGQAWRMIRGRPRVDVELWFDPAFAETIADTHWHSTQQIDWEDDGSIIFRCQVDGLDEIVWWVLSMGPNCKVRQPRALAERVRHLAEGVVRHYADYPEALGGSAG